MRAHQLLTDQVKTMGRNDFCKAVSQRQSKPLEFQLSRHLSGARDYGS